MLKKDLKKQIVEVSIITMKMLREKKKDI